jgi:hypothetical protein
MILPIYLLIGLIYWLINSFVRKLETDGDYLLPMVWFLAWPLAAITWLIILGVWIKEYLVNKFTKNQL